LDAFREDEAAMLATQQGFDDNLADFMDNGPNQNSDDEDSEGSGADKADLQEDPELDQEVAEYLGMGEEEDEGAASSSGENSEEDYSLFL